MGSHFHPFSFHYQIEQLHMLCKSQFKKTLQTCYRSQEFLMEIFRHLLNKAKHYDTNRKVKRSREEYES